MSKVQKPRLGRGLRSLIPGTAPAEQLPVEIELPTPVPGPAPPAERTSDRQRSSDLPSPADPSNTQFATAVTPPDTTINARPVPDNNHTSGQTVLVSPDKVHPNPHQPRRSVDEAKVAELAASIRTTGLIQPIIVRKTADDSYQLIAGERRLRAARLAGLTAIPAIIRSVSSYEQAQMALIENIQREDLNPMDRAASYRALMDQLGLTQAELAARLGEDRSSIANHVRLLDLQEWVQQLVHDGKLTLGHAKLLAGVGDPLEQERLANLVISQELSVRNLERLMLEPHDGPAVPRHRSAAPSAHIQDLERTLTRQLGLRVQVKSGAKGRGRLVIHYRDLDEFDGLVSRLGVEMDVT